MFSIANDRVFDSAKTALVDKSSTDKNSCDYRRALFVHRDNIAAFRHYDIVQREAQTVNVILVTIKLTVFAVDRNNKLWPHGLEHYSKIFLAGVSGNVNS